MSSNLFNKLDTGNLSNIFWFRKELFLFSWTGASLNELHRVVHVISQVASENKFMLNNAKKKLPSDSVKILVFLMHFLDVL